MTVENVLWRLRRVAPRCDAIVLANPMANGITQIDREPVGSLEQDVGQSAEDEIGDMVKAGVVVATQGWEKGDRRMEA